MEKPDTRFIETNLKAGQTFAEAVSEAATQQRLYWATREENFRAQGISGQALDEMEAMLSNSSGLG